MISGMLDDCRPSGRGSGVVGEKTDSDAFFHSSVACARVPFSQLQSSR